MQPDPYTEECGNWKLATYVGENYVILTVLTGATVPLTKEEARKLAFRLLNAADRLCYPR